MFFLSDIVNTNVRQFDGRFFSPPSDEKSPRSALVFSEEYPSPTDWARWAEFWSRRTLPGLYLHTPLGKYVEPTHCDWQWFYDPRNMIIEQ